MNDIKIIFEDDEWIEFELSQPNDLIGNTVDWTDEDWVYWKNKMDDLEKNGTIGQFETIKVKLKKNPIIDGTKLITGSEGETDNR